MVTFKSRCEWCIVIRYTDDDYRGRRIDAYWCESAVYALTAAARGPLRPGEHLRCVWAQTDEERTQAYDLHTLRAIERERWQQLVTEIEDGWFRAQHQRSKEC